MESSEGVVTTSRQRILDKISKTTRVREKVAHPGPLETPGSDRALDAFVERFTRSGGEVVRASEGTPPGEWLAGFVVGLGLDRNTMAIGNDVPDRLVPDLPRAAPKDAALGLSMAWGAVAETGTLILPSTGGRAVQLLPPVHLVWISTGRIFDRLEPALNAFGADLPAALGLHSAPSKSADIGRTLVTGVHGPGRIIAVLFEEDE